MSLTVTFKTSYVKVELLRDEKSTLEASARSDASRAQHESELAAQVSC